MRGNPYTTSSSIEPEAQPSDSRTPPRREARAAGPVELRIALLGLNAWAVSLLVPSLHIGLSSRDALITCLPLAVLGLGLAILGRSPERARWLLLAAYPPSLGAVLAWHTELTTREVHGSLGLALAALSLLAFAAAVAHASAPGRRSRASTPTPLARAPVLEPSRRRWLRRALLALSALGALALTLVAPTFFSRSERLERWGEATDDATVLASVVAAVVSCIALAVVVGPALRAPRLGEDDPMRRQRRLAVSMLVAVTAGVGWLVLWHLERAAGL